MDNDKILDYVMNSPANTNPNVLKTMLDSSGSGGSGGGGTEPLIVSLTPNGEDDAILSKTWQEIYDAMSQGRTALIVFANAGNENVAHYPIIEASLVGETNYSVYFLTRNNETVSVQVFSCQSADDQPSTSGGGY